MVDEAGLEECWYIEGGETNAGAELHAWSELNSREQSGRSFDSQRSEQSDCERIQRLHRTIVIPVVDL